MRSLPLVLLFAGCPTPTDTGLVSVDSPLDSEPAPDSQPPETDPPETDPPDTGEPPPPPALGSVRGDGVVLVWTDRPLASGERLERWDKRGWWASLAEEGQAWADPTPSAAYRWRDRHGLSLETNPEDVHLELPEPEGLTLAVPGQAVHRDLAVDGPSLSGLRVGVTVQREDDGSWLMPVCTSGSDPCWSASSTSWGSWDGAELPGLVALAWPAEAGEPSMVVVRATLTAEVDGIHWTLARTETRVPETGRLLAWGDLHGHTNLSYDGCENPEHLCGPRGTTPAADFYAQAEAAGLAFAAMTDHVEFSTWQLPEEGLQVDVREETLRLAQAAEGGTVLPIVGYEWTGLYRDDSGASVGGHRTVIFESLEPCVDLWISAGTGTSRKDALGLETYTRRRAVVSRPDSLQLGMAAVDCPGERYRSWFHHPALTLPAGTVWSSTLNHLGDTVVEIQSEHGSSECQDLAAEGCDWRVREDNHVPEGSYQAALQAGLQLGVVGGSDNHEGRPGPGGPGAVPLCVDTDGDGVIDAASWAFTAGAVTGILYPGPDLDRGAILDAVDARETFAASWLVPELRVAAIGADGGLYLPGTEVPAAASPLELRVELDDSGLDSWTVELLDAWGEVVLSVPGPAAEPFDLVPGEARYVRIRALVEGEEQRAWASPFFGASGD